MLDKVFWEHAIMCFCLAGAGVMLDLLLKRLFLDFKEWVEEDDLLRGDETYIRIRNPFPLWL